MLNELFSLGVTVEELQAKIDRKSAISLQRGKVDPKFQLKGSPHINQFAWIVRLMDALLSPRVFTQRNFLADFLQAKCNFFFFKRSAISHRKRPFCVFQPPLRGGGLRATYDDHLRLIGKRVVDFLLVIIELFSLNVTAEAL